MNHVSVGSIRGRQGRPLSVILPKQTISIFIYSPAKNIQLAKNRGMDCPFCDKKIIESQAILEGEHCFALQSIRPANFGQCLVIPKRHVLSIRELNQAEASDLILMVRKISTILKEKLNPVGLNYGFNEGKYAGQSIAHYHFHIMPRFEGDKDKLPEYHLFHRDPRTKSDLSDEKLKILVDKFRALANEADCQNT